MKQGRALQRKEQRKSEEGSEREHEERPAVSGSLDGPGDALCFYRIVLPSPPVCEVPSALQRTRPQTVPDRLEQIKGRTYKAEQQKLELVCLPPQMQELCNRVQLP